MKQSRFLFTFFIERKAIVRVLIFIISHFYIRYLNNKSEWTTKLDIWEND